MCINSECEFSFFFKIQSSISSAITSGSKCFKRSSWIFIPSIPVYYHLGKGIVMNEVRHSSSSCSLLFIR